MLADIPTPSIPCSWPGSSHRPGPCLSLLGLARMTGAFFLHASCVTRSLASSFQVKFFYLCQLAYWLHALPELYFQKVRKVSTHFSLWKPFVLPSPPVPSGPLSLPRQAQSIGW